MKNISLMMCALVTLFLPASGVSKDGQHPSGPAHFTMPSGLQPGDYMQQTIVFKVLPDYRAGCFVNNIELPVLNAVLEQLGQVSLTKMFPNAAVPPAPKNEAGFPYADLTLIYQFSYSSSMALEKAINLVIATGLVQYAEPKYIPKAFYTPNDPSISQQYFLSKIQAYSAWNISKGDSTIVIGITDTGTDTNHPDLAANLKHNYADPVNGIDDDGDTYVDNFSGWDLGENDNNPAVGSCATCSHGSHVSGCAAAVTDNGTGVASTGFKSKFLPVKIADANGSLIKAYEGVAYAADHGCQIINCSWGSGGGGQAGQDVMTYAAINKNALVVAASGNTYVEQYFYPGSYNYVLNVTATDDQDVKAGFSTYGPTVDVSAPGVDIYSTLYNNTYANSSGTSMASPVTAGAAAIVKSFYPSYTGLQVGEQLRVTADNIDAVSGNAAFASKLGTGRINLYRALTESRPSVRMENMVMTDNNDNTFITNDTVSISGDIRNYLAPTSNLVATLSSTSPYVTIIDNSTTGGVIPTLGVYNNTPDPFTIKINSNAPINASIKMRIDYTDGAYTDFQIFYFTANVDYINVVVNDIGTTVTSKGRIGYNGTAQAQGLGFMYKGGATLLYEAGLMIGESSAAVSDMVRGDPQGTIDNDFQSSIAVHYDLPSVKSDVDISGRFNDNLSPSVLNLLVNHHFYAWSLAGHTKYVIFEYIIKNNGSNALNSLYAGIYADFDIGAGGADNKANTDAPNKLGYCYRNVAGGFYTGIRVLTPTPFLHFATDNDGANGGISNYDGFTTSEKYQTLSTNHLTAGGTGAGADVSNIVSTGPFALNPGDSVKVAFALIAGDDLNDIQGSASNAQIKYDGLTGITEPLLNSPTLQLGSVFPNPAGDHATISLFTSQQLTANMQLTDALGRLVYTQDGINLNTGGNLIDIETVSFDNGLYTLTIHANEKTIVTKVMVAH